MNNQKSRNPDVDWGFHATIPRVIRTEYKDLTPVQKWLYVSLKDLCGEFGMCYRTLRVLEEETGVSIGMLSESIRKLHEDGLIHAEKKKRSSGGKEVWHITIVDIWQANAKVHPTKRSHSEQTLENVHRENKNVHRTNDNTLERSASEQECSHSETEEVSSSSISNEAVSREEGVATATTRAFTNSQEIDPEITEKRKVTYKTDTNTVQQPPADVKPITNPVKAVKPVSIPKHVTKKPITMAENLPSQEAIRIMDAWDSIFKRPCTRTENHIKAAELLVPCAPTRSDLDKIRKFCYSSNPKWYGDKGVSLIDVSKNFDKWQSLQEAPPEASNGHSPPQNASLLLKQFGINKPVEAT